MNPLGRSQAAATSVVAAVDSPSGSKSSSSGASSTEGKWFHEAVASNKKVRLSDEPDETDEKKWSKSCIYWLWKLNVASVLTAAASAKSLGREESQARMCRDRMKAQGKAGEYKALSERLDHIDHCHVVASTLEELVKMDDTMVNNAIDGLAGVVAPYDYPSNIKEKLFKRAFLRHRNSMLATNSIEAFETALDMVSLESTGKQLDLKKPQLDALDGSTLDKTQTVMDMIVKEVFINLLAAATVSDEGTPKANLISFMGGAIQSMEKRLQVASSEAWSDALLELAEVGRFILCLAEPTQALSLACFVDLHMMEKKKDMAAHKVLALAFAEYPALAQNLDKAQHHGKGAQKWGAEVDKQRKNLAANSTFEAVEWGMGVLRKMHDDGTAPEELLQALSIDVAASAESKLKEVVESDGSNQNLVIRAQALVVACEDYLPLKKNIWLDVRAKLFGFAQRAGFRKMVSHMLSKSVAVLDVYADDFDNFHEQRDVQAMVDEIIKSVQVFGVTQVDFSEDQMGQLLRAVDKLMCWAVKTKGSSHLCETMIDACNRLLAIRLGANVDDVRAHAMSAIECRRASEIAVAGYIEIFDGDHVQIYEHDQKKALIRMNAIMQSVLKLRPSLQAIASRRGFSDVVETVYLAGEEMEKQITAMINSVAVHACTSKVEHLTSLVDDFKKIAKGRDNGESWEKPAADIKELLGHAKTSLFVFDGATFTAKKAALEQERDPHSIGSQAHTKYPG